MLKRINWKAVLFSFLWLISLGGLVTLMGFIEIKKDEARCTDVRVLIPGMESFIDRAEVDNIIQSSTGALVGRSLHHIDIHKLEKALQANPYIESARVYADMDGIINIEISQREPVLRVLNLLNQDFYVDKYGLKIPVSLNFTPHVLVANGFIMEPFRNKVDTLQTSIARDLFKTALFVQSDTLWREQIEQIYVNQQNEMELIPRVGDHKIILGNADSLETKFSNLLAFYKKALPTVGWNAYKIINIKYANQIVCVRNIVDSAALLSTPKPAQAIKPPQDTVKNIQDTVNTSIH